MNVEINNLGFRGSNINRQKTKRRVVFIGDSFTFGWGVELEKTWVELLSKSYPEIEFLNLGQGGNHPGDYIQVLKRVLPVLKPDLLIVCVLQGNDLHQLMQLIKHENNHSELTKPKSIDETKEQKINRILGLIYPYFSKRFSKTTSIQNKWVKDAKALAESLNGQKQAKYQLIKKKLRTAFEKGALNPSLIYESIHHPRLFSQATDTSSQACKNGIERLHDHLQEAEQLAASQNAQTIFVSMPNRPYGFVSELAPLTELGFEVKGADTINANLTFKQATQGLYSPVLLPQMAGEGLFFTYDGHWNENGNRIFAHQLKLKLDSLPEWKHFLTSSNF